MADDCSLPILEWHCVSAKQQKNDFSNSNFVILAKDLNLTPPPLRGSRLAYQRSCSLETRLAKQGKEGKYKHKLLFLQLSLVSNYSCSRNVSFFLQGSSFKLVLSWIPGMLCFCSVGTGEAQRRKAVHQDLSVLQINQGKMGGFQSTSLLPTGAFTSSCVEGKDNLEPWQLPFLQHH